MSLEEQLRAEMQRFVDGRGSLEALRAWGRKHYQRLHHLADPVAARLYLAYEAAVAEYSIGTCSEADMRAYLRDALNRAAPVR